MENFMFYAVYEGIKHGSKYYMKDRINLFVFNAPFLYPLKTLESLTVFYFQGVQKGFLGLILEYWHLILDIRDQ